MSMATLEKGILEKVRVILNNKKLKMDDILEWSSGSIKPESEDEFVFEEPYYKVNVCVLKKNNLRPGSNSSANQK